MEVLKKMHKRRKKVKIKIPEGDYLVAKGEILVLEGVVDGEEAEIEIEAL